MAERHRLRRSGSEPGERSNRPERRIKPLRVFAGRIEPLTARRSALSIAVPPEGEDDDNSLKYKDLLPKNTGSRPKDTG